MNDKELNNGRKKYNKIQKEKKYYLNKKKELEALKKDPKVIEYLKTTKYLSNHTDAEFEEKNIVNKAFGNIASRTEDSNNIIVFLGFKDENDNSCINPNRIEYAVFMDLETMEAVNIYYENYSKFCKNRNIIYFDDEYKYHNTAYYTEKFFELRNEYLESLIELDQEVAKEKILKK